MYQHCNGERRGSRGNGRCDPGGTKDSKAGSRPAGLTTFATVSFVEMHLAYSVRRRRVQAPRQSASGNSSISSSLEGPLERPEVRAHGNNERLGTSCDGRCDESFVLPRGNADSRQPACCPLVAHSQAGLLECCSRLFILAARQILEKWQRSFVRQKCTNYNR